MTTSKLTTGQKFEFTETGKVFEIKLVTEKRVSWWIGFAHLANVNTMRATSISREKFEYLIQDGTYKLV